MEQMRDRKVEGGGMNTEEKIMLDMSLIKKNVIM